LSETLVMGITYVLTWRAQPGACMKCLALNGQQWEIDDLEMAPLISASVSHPRCKCELDVEIQVDPMEFQVW